MSVGTARGMLAVAATLVIAFFAAPRDTVTRAQGAADAHDAQADATPSVIAEGPPGRIALNGPWVLRSDRAAHGTAKGWQAGGFVGSSIELPNAANAKRITGHTGIESFRGTVGWYSTQFSVPQNGAYVIRFESVNHRATVWLDGRELGSHTGTYLPFEYDVSLTAGQPHTLVVRADWRGPAEMKRQGWHRTWFNFGGINREVSIRPLAGSELSAPTVNTTLQGDGAAKVDLSVHVDNKAAQGRAIPVHGVLQRDGQSIAFDFPTVQVPAHATRVVSQTVTVPQPALWSPSAPNLYELDLTVPNETSYTLKTGLRQLTKRGRTLLLNGKPIKLHGASLQEDAKGHGDALTPADMDEIVAELKQIGANATRAQHPLNPALLERLDAAGIMVWQEVGPIDAPGAWTSTTPALRAEAKRRVLQTVYQSQTHPSIIAWNLANEVAGNGHPGGQASYIDAMARELHQRDPGRLVALDVWGKHPPKIAGPMYRDIDAIGDTNYIGWYELTRAPQAQVRAAIHQHVENFLKTFQGKIVVVTEFGAEANGLNATNSPGGYRFQADLLSTHIEQYRSIPQLSGMLVWNLRDFAVSPAFAGGSIRLNVPNIHLVRGLNQKGLFTYDGRPKLSARVVQSLYAQIEKNGR